MRAELKAWMKEQGDKEKVFSKLLLLGDPVIMYTPNGNKAEDGKT